MNVIGRIHEVGSLRCRTNNDLSGGVDKEISFEKQDLKFYRRKAKNLKEETKMGAEALNGSEHTCFECGKNYCSLKLLDSHLRCHLNT